MTALRYRGIEFKPFSRQARVLSLAPNASELIVFVGATTQLVGCTEIASEIAMFLWLKDHSI